MARHDFLDHTTGTILELVIDDVEGAHGVAHPPCTTLAEVHPQLDAWQCTDCGRKGRVEGAWAQRMWHTDLMRADWRTRTRA